MQRKGLELVMLRNAFYRDGYRFARLGMLILIVLNVLLGFSVFHKYMNPAPPRYFAATSDGRIINVHPLTDPAVTDSYVIQWTADAVRRSFSQDFIHWRRQLQDISQYYTPKGWSDFTQQMKSSNNLKTLVALKMVSNVQITGAPKVVQKAVVGGHYAWKIEMPVLVTYSNAARSIPMAFKVDLIVLRMPEKDYPDRIAISNFLPQETGNSAAQAMANGMS